MALDPMWAVTALSLFGNVLNVKKNKWGFMVWIIANVLWLIYDAVSGLYSRVFLGLVQTAFCIWGLFKWNDEEE